MNDQLGWIVGYTDAYNGVHTCHFQAESINQQTSLPLPALIIYWLNLLSFSINGVFLGNNNL